MADIDLDQWLAEFIDPMDEGQPYREPTSAEADLAVDGLHRLISGGDAAALLTPLGLTVTTGIDTASGTAAGRLFALAFSEPPPGDRAWAAVLLDLTEPVRIVIGCPHPVFDTSTEQIGLQLWRRTPGALLLVAGAHRRAGGGQADPRNHPGSPFHLVAATLLDAGLPHLQLHGFADSSAPGFDVVLSPGAATAGRQVVRAADSLAAHGLAVARAWGRDNPAPNLDGSTNIQGRTASAAGSTFVHVEASATTRASQRQQLVDALVAADVAGTGWPGTVFAARSVVLDGAPNASTDLLLDPATGRSFAVGATGTVSVRMAAREPADGTSIVLEVFADGAACTVEFATPTTVTTGIGPSFAVPTGRLGLFSLYYSARARRWVVTAAAIEP